MNAGALLKGEETMEATVDKLFAEIIEVADGKLTRSEILGHREFGIYRLDRTF